MKRLFSSAMNIVVLLGTLGIMSTVEAADVLINEYNAVGTDKYLDDSPWTASTKADSYFATIPGLNGNGRIEGNGGNWVELVVIADHTDMRGWHLDWEEVFFDENEVPLGTHTGIVSFSSTANIWSDLRSGTIITISEDQFIAIDTTIDAQLNRNFTKNVAPGDVDVTLDLSTDTSYSPSTDDWWIHVSTLQEQAKTPSERLLTSSTTNTNDGPGNMSVTNDSWEITIFDSSNSLVFGPVGEDTSTWADEQTGGTGVSSKEVGKLEIDPSDSITDNRWYNDGETSSFGQPNVWDGGEGVQDFSSLRSVVSSNQPGDFNGDGVVDAADYTVWRDELGTTYTSADYDIWKANFGNSILEDRSSTAMNSTTAVPEPTSFCMLALGGVLCLGALRLRLR